MVWWDTLTRAHKRGCWLQRWQSVEQPQLQWLSMSQNPENPGWHPKNRYFMERYVQSLFWHHHMVYQLYPDIIPRFSIYKPCSNHTTIGIHSHPHMPCPWCFSGCIPAEKRRLQWTDRKDCLAPLGGACWLWAKYGFEAGLHCGISTI